MQKNGKSHTKNITKTATIIWKINFNKDTNLTRRTFLRKVFLIPAKIIQKIHKNIFQYLWQIKIPEPITRKTLFLRKSKGGLNIKESEARNLSIHIKH